MTTLFFSIATAKADDYTPTDGEVNQCKAAIATLVAVGVGLTRGQSLQGSIGAASVFTMTASDNFDTQCTNFLQEMNDDWQKRKMNDSDVADYYDVICGGDSLCGNLPHLDPYNNPLCNPIIYNSCPTNPYECESDFVGCLNMMVNLSGNPSIGEIYSAMDYIRDALDHGAWAHDRENPFINIDLSINAGN